MFMLNLQCNQLNSTMIKSLLSPLQWLKKIIILFCIISISTAIIAGCSNDDESDPLSQLPPATQTGEHTFACLVDGEPFIHNDGPINCFYQYIDGGYGFGIQGKFENKNPSSVSFGTLNKSLSEGEVLLLKESIQGNATGSVFFRIPGATGEASATNSEYTGELTITKFDSEANIVSGTFWFDVQHPVTGQRVEVREGRFDTYFTQ